jgi:hypothetical protein
MSKQVPYPPKSIKNKMSIEIKWKHPKNTSFLVPIQNKMIQPMIPTAWNEYDILLISLYTLAWSFASSELN